MTEADRQLRQLEILGGALELDGDARHDYLTDACGADQTLRQEVEALLQEEVTGTDDFFERPPVDLIDSDDLAHGRTIVMTSAFQLKEPLQPKKFGTYRIVKRLGKGGMGTVYLGEQEEPVRRRVALKIIDAVHQPRQVQRFAVECQALAHLGHPNVASLYEVGATEDDHPFVAMELVEGTTITDWCDHKRLRLSQRIELFYGVCAGVRHAHEKGILHRDIKPSNVLVTEIDGRPTAKVIDFGVARALDDPLIDGHPQMTLDHQIIGSPAYMSPETARGERDLDTRSDVYTLGILLYELLVGVLPFDLETESLASLLRRLTKGDLPTPSARFADLDPGRKTAIAAYRRLSDTTLTRRLRGDLDAIIGRATAVDRDDRYSSPADLAADLAHHLGHRPVTARPASVPYRLGRYLRRHMGMALATTALMLALMAGIVASSLQARRANLEAQQARELSRFLVDLFEVADPERDPADPVDVRELLDRSADKLPDALHDQPLARARFLHTIAEIYTKLALFERAEALANEALALRRAELPAEHSELLESANQLGVIYRRQQRFDDAEPLLRQVLAARESSAKREPLAFAQALNNYGNLLWNQRRNEEAVATHQQALEIRERELGPMDPNVGETLNNLGVLLRSLRRYDEAVPYLMRADRIFAQVLGSEHPIRAAGLNNLGMVEHRLQRWQDAENHLQQAIAIWQETYGERHPRTLKARTNLAKLFLDMGRDTEAAELLRTDLLIHEDLRSPAVGTVAATARDLGIALGRLGDFEPAAEALQQAREIYVAERGEESLDAIQARSNLAWLAWRQGHFVEAETEHREILEIRKQTRGPDHLTVGSTLRNIALALIGQGRDSEAEPLLRRALEIREAGYGETHRRVGQVLLDLGELIQQSGQPDEARHILTRAVDIYREMLPPDHRELHRATAALNSP